MVFKVFVSFLITFYEVIFQNFDLNFLCGDESVNLLPKVLITKQKIKPNSITDENNL